MPPSGQRSKRSRWAYIPESNVSQARRLDAASYYESPEFAYGMTHLDGTRVSFLWLDFLTDAELEAKLNGGSDALMQIFKRNKHSPILNTARPSYVYRPWSCV